MKSVVRETGFQSKINEREKVLIIIKSILICTIRFVLLEKMILNSNWEFIEPFISRDKKKGRIRKWERNFLLTNLGIQYELGSREKGEGLRH